jgi:lysophospholipase L1-like esterase
MTVSAPQKQATKQPQSVAARPRKNIFVAILPFIVWQIIALLFAEGVLYFCGLGEEEIFKLDKEMGFTHMPSKRVTWRSEGYSVSYFDADGMREPNLTIAKPANTYRIALLGDSMVESLQVPLDETFGQILEKELSKETNRNVQVLNFGNSGYSTAQDYLQLKRKVMKYSPDLVLLGYSNRDIFENWSPPDQTITNVRPFALHLPGAKLVVDNGSVVRWMKSPRAKFLKQMEWFRQNSRIYGLISATETQLSFRDPFYRALCGFFTNPKAAMNNFWAGMRSFSFSKIAAPSFHIQFFEGPASQLDAKTADNSSKKAPAGSKPAPRAVPARSVEAALVDSSIAAAPKEIPGQKVVLEEVAPSKGASALSTSSATPQPAVDQKAKAKQIYVDLMSRTMGSLLREMKSECENHGARFAMVTMPCRAALCPTANLETAFFNMTYQDEINILQKLCSDENIPFIDAETEAAKLKQADQLSLFYAVHLRAPGHVFLAKQLEPFLAESIRQQTAKN